LLHLGNDLLGRTDRRLVCHLEEAAATDALTLLRLRDQFRQLNARPARLSRRTLMGVGLSYNHPWPERHDATRR
jgi:hypothetical protein